MVYSVCNTKSYYIIWIKNGFYNNGDYNFIFSGCKYGDGATDLEIPKLHMKNNPYNFLSKFLNIMSKFSIVD